MQQKLQHLQPILVNRKGPILLHNSAQLHVPQPTLQKVNTLHDKVLPHLPHSPDLLPTENHFLEHLDKFLRGKCFHNQQENASTTTTRTCFPLVWEDHLRGWNQAMFRRWLLTVYGSWTSVATFPAPGHPAHFRLAPQSRLTLAIPVTACPEFSGFYTLTVCLSSLKSRVEPVSSQFSVQS